MEDIQRRILKLTPQEMETLSAWLKVALKESKQEEALRQVPLKKGREVVETRSAGKITYRRELVKCGKKKCKCNKGKLHGPYWYTYSWNGKKLSSTYLGKTLKEVPTEGSSEQEAWQNNGGSKPTST
ncbi:hypothetical protein AVDCRST_MAG94-1511 [uncultured Leptolyngbya sp.]|uniref:DUF6788 domain-containing protein n=1 Tax=uncultured Leptolyngbya sp. TaxID=332963 RepID=A0A6J4L3T6_9CYAN|nr:hypothetical protein AVDCRST_MAG94-1511 [uncultured Leptolyngbya sp.]